ncbi:MAG TPA: hypothetical protein VNX21_02420, partial [Candidatus Thermoplasmatota archaeon]|nr:hypothetical protein [Candidatus Thermoplasmatota archaeon]
RRWRAPEPDPRATFEVAPGATHLLLACLAGGQGEQRVLVAGPSGTTLSCERSSPLSPGQPAFSMDVGPASPGTWVARAAATGGFVEAEAYALVVEERAVGGGAALLHGRGPSGPR